MTVQNLALQNFRSYSEESFLFDSRITIIVGPNASGKTNILEAVSVLCGHKSFRGSDQDMVRHETSLARVEAVLDTGEERSLNLQVAAPNINRTYVVNGVVYRRLPRPRRLPVVLFEPNHLQLIQGSPELRRSFIDDLLTQTTLGYEQAISQYKRVLAQRNALLKDNSNNIHDQLFVWDIRLSDLAARLVRHRLELVEAFNASLGHVHGRISDSASNVKIAYQASFEPDSYSTKMLQALQTSTPKDIQRGFTSHGPHREDLEINLAGQDAAQTASRGETRSLVLALKIISLNLVEEKSGKKPILLLDDVFGELDKKRRKALTDYIGDFQTLITTTDKDLIDSSSSPSIIKLI